MIKWLKCLFRGHRWMVPDCERDMLCVGIDPKNVSREDKIRLNDLGFLCDANSWCFYSFRFGSHGVYGL